MATQFIGKSGSTRTTAPVYQKQINSANLATGAAVVYDSSAAGDLVKAPAGAGAAAGSAFAGLIVTEYIKGGGSAVGQDVNVQRTGIGYGLLKASTAVTVGQELVIGGVDGTLRPYNDATDDGAEIVGVAEQTLSSQTYVQPLKVNLDMSGPVHIA